MKSRIYRSRGPFPRFPDGAEGVDCDPAPTITADPASQAQGMGAQLHTLAGIVDAPPLAPDPLLLHDPGIW